MLKFSSRIQGLAASPIRDILAVIEREGMVSFAGGLPDPESFPEAVSLNPPPSKLQYGATEGEPELRARIASDLNERGVYCDVEQVIVLSGSQQGIDLVAKLFVDPGSPIAVESPSYLAALQVLRFFGAKLNTFVPAHTTNIRESLSGQSLAYAIPNFQNPTGKCYSSVERDALADACDALNLPLFEDDPYRDLAYEACDTSPVVSRLQRASWIYQGSFSKSLAPGFRLGYLVCSRDLLSFFVRLKQAADLHSNRVSQWWVYEQLSDPNAGSRIGDLVDRYRAKRDYFDSLLQKYFSGLATWRVPPGGLFFWLRLQTEDVVDTRELLAPAIERGVAFMPGEPFYADPRTRENTLRLSFAHADEVAAERGIATLAEIVAARLNRLQ